MTNKEQAAMRAAVNKAYEDLCGALGWACIRNANHPPDDLARAVAALAAEVERLRPLADLGASNSGKIDAALCARITALEAALKPFAEVDLSKPAVTVRSRGAEHRQYEVSEEAIRRAAELLKETR